MLLFQKMSQDSQDNNDIKMFSLFFLILITYAVHKASQLICPVPVILAKDRVVVSVVLPMKHTNKFSKLYLRS